MANSKYVLYGDLGVGINEQYNTAQKLDIGWSVGDYTILRGGQAAVFGVVDTDVTGGATCSLAASGTFVATTSIAGAAYIIGPSVSVSSGNYCWAYTSSVLA